MGRNSEKKKSKFPVDMHIYIVHGMSFTTTKFHEILMSGFRGVVLTNCLSSIFHFGKNSKLKKVVTPEKNMNQNFRWICAFTHYVLHNYKVLGNSVEGFQKSCADKKNGLTNWLNEWLTDGRVKNYTLRNSLRGVNNFILNSRVDALALLSFIWNILVVWAIFYCEA